MIEKRSKLFDRVEALRRSGLTQKEIGKKTGLHEGTVRRWLGRLAGPQTERKLSLLHKPVKLRGPASKRMRAKGNGILVVQADGSGATLGLHGKLVRLQCEDPRYIGRIISGIIGGDEHE